MDVESVKHIVYSKIEEIPTLSTVIDRLLALLESPRSSSRDIAEAISYDPALTSKILKVANSAYYGFQGRITSLTDAVTLLGINMIRSIALSMSLIKNLSSDRGLKNFTEYDFWIHSLTVATAMQELSRRYFPNYTGQEHVFIVGLLHDLGRIVFDQFFTSQYREAIRLSTDRKVELYIAEKEIIGVDHAEIGGMILKRWKFPETIILPIAYHHSTLDFKHRVDTVMLNLLRLSDTMAFALYSSTETDLMNECQPYLDQLSLDKHVITDISEYLESSKTRILDFYSAIA